jgi:hypothetical protein
LCYVIKDFAMQPSLLGRSGNFYKGNMHTHSTNSGGAHAPDKVCAMYREKGYDFLVMTDHFMERYQWPITDTRSYRTDSFTTLIGTELHAPCTELGEIWHIKAIGLPLDFEPLGAGETGPEIAKRAYDTGAFIGLVHPSWYGLTPSDARTIPFAHAIEVYNHGCAVEVDRGNDWPFLDTLLNENWRLTGYATDDAHLLTHDWLGGWVMVEADEPDPSKLLHALKQGRYYSSQGPEIYDIRIEGECVVVESSEVGAVAAQGRGARSESKLGSGMRTATLPLKRFKDTWFRVTVIDEAGRRAWSNPFWLD